MMDQEVAFSRTPQAGVIVSRIAVPRQNESVLALPPLDQWPGWANQNIRFFSSCDFDIQGRSLRDLRSDCRTEILSIATQYTRSLIGHQPQPSPAEPLVVTGHQPELFHPGVWAKNFATAGIAKNASGTGLNLIIDNDTVSSTRIRVPVGPAGAPSIEWCPFDSALSQQPWEEANVVDPDCFRRFAGRVQDLIRANWKFDPIIADVWPAAVEHLNESRRLCDCLAAARTAAERSMGLRNLEVPMSRVCSTHSFCWFAAYLMLHLPRLHQIYNRAVRDYRRTNRIRSVTHPVPELETQDDWLEAPFWIWRVGEQRRERPFVRRNGHELEIRDRQGWSARLPISPDRSLEDGASALQELQRKGLRFRTRALTTTLFARVCLADLFVHGIGGAKYDLMTDAICREYFQFTAPPFATVSATVYLPLSVPYPDTAERLLSLRHAIRDCKYNPDRRLNHLDADSRVLIDEKRDLLAKITGRRPSKNEHRQLERINGRLSVAAEASRHNFVAESEIVRRHSAANSIYEDREFSWALHPAAGIQHFMNREFLN